MRTYVLLAGALYAASPLAGQDTTRTMSLTLDAGLVNASGNSEFLSANFGEKVTWALKSRWTVTQTAKVLYGETDGARTTESYDFNLRGERVLSPRVGAYAFAAFQRDPFAGLAARWSGGPGVAWGVVKAARDTLGLEAASYVIRFDNQPEPTFKKTDRILTTGVQVAL